MSRIGVPEKQKEKQKPVASWLDVDYFTEERRAIKALTVILRTAGCRWRTCTMCGYWQESAEVTQADILAQLEHALTKSPQEEFILKIFTSGSFLDDHELSSETRKRIAQMVQARREIKKLIVETRPEFVSPTTIEDLQVVERLELAIGLETADDFIRSRFIIKGFSFDEYKKAAEIAKDYGALVKTYLLLKPPFVAEKKAIEDVIKSAQRVAQYSSTISLNLCTVQKQTPLEALWRRRYYRPPWLWSAVDAIMGIASQKLVVISDPVGAGHERGPHNCGTCDPRIIAAIRSFNKTQNVQVLEALNEVECTCRNVWQMLLSSDDFLFGSTTA
ncbi:MAG: TIGR01210 family radical SAM protein [Methanophagales archaeon ANME-1-THS]|nr:MAG: TIGR01210 family radical SAM protein [Methanophagales archaeon ANME-1-THS]